MASATSPVMPAQIIDQILSTDTTAPEYLQQLVTNMDTLLYHSSNKGKQTANDDKLASVRAELPSASQVAKFSEEASKNVRLISSQISGSSGDKHSTAISVLNAIGNVHWVGVGFLLVAAVIEKLDKIKQNKEECLELLKSMNDLAKLLLQLQRLPHLKKEMNDKMEESIRLIVDGAISCCVQKKRRFPGRLLVAGTDVQELAKLRSQVDEMGRMLLSQISLSTLDVVHDNIVCSHTPVPSHNSAVVGIDHKIAEVIQLLEWDNDKLAVAVVIHGIGGAGKTTLANEVFASLNLQGWKYSKVTLIKNLELNPNIEEIQSQILSNLTGIKQSVSDFQGGQQELKSLIEKEILFLYIDNILRREDLEKLLPTLIGSTPKKVRILVTARKTTISGAFESCGIKPCKLYPIESLSVEAALKLLCRKIDSERDIDSMVEERPQAKQIAEKCSCCPLFLEVVGAYLYKKNNKAEAYEKVIVWLRDGEDFSCDKEDSFEESRILFAYNELTLSAQEAFLDICSFFNDWEWKEVVCIVGEDQMDCLLEGALVKRTEVEASDGTTIERISIHDLILRAGRNKSKDSRFRSVADFSIAMENERDLAQTKGVWLKYNYKPFHVSAEVLDNMSRSLRVFGMGSNTIVSGQCSKRFDELRFLQAGKVPNLGIDILKLKDLRFMDYSFKENKIWSLPKNFSGLKVLKLKRSSGTDGGNIHADIEFGYLIKLERLELEGFHNTEVSSFVKLYGLRKLKLSRIEGLEELPWSIGKLRSLQELHIFSCVDLMRLGEGIGELNSLAKFGLKSCCKLVELPSVFQKLLSLQSLNLSNCSNLVRLPEGLENLPYLKYIDVEGCEKLISLPNRVCKLSFWKNTTSFSGISSLKELPEEICKFKTLTRVSLYGCKVLPIGFGQLSCLENLELNKCESLQELSDEFHCLASLKTLHMSGCKSLSRLPEGFGKLGCLERLELSVCDKIQELCSDFGCLAALRYLDLSKCKSLSKLPGGFGKLGCLERLVLSGSDKLQELCSDFGCLAALKYLDLSKCKSLSKLPGGFGKLGCLERLVLPGCDKLQELCSDFGCLAALKYLDLSKCKSLSKLPGGFGKLGCLERLVLSGCDTLQELCSDFGCLVALKYLDLSKCKNLSKLPKSFGKLGCLENLKLSECDKIEELCSDFGCLGALKYLDLSKCKNLSKFPDGFGQLGCSELLVSPMCSKLEDLSSDFRCLTSLIKLDLSNCESLGEKWMDNVGSIQSLWRLNVSRSEKMIRRWIEMKREKEDWSFTVVTDSSWKEKGEGQKALLLKVVTAIMSIVATFIDFIVIYK